MGWFIFVAIVVGIVVVTVKYRDSEREWLTKEISELASRLGCEMVETRSLETLRRQKDMLFLEESRRKTVLDTERQRRLDKARINEQLAAEGLSLGDLGLVGSGVSNG
jgi:hypothetical protein